MALSKGTRLGRYEITAAIGAGGMGEVYRATDTRLDRTVAIKILPHHLADRADLRERFEREAKTVSHLEHPHICAIHDVGEQDGVHYIVMEHLDGENLAQRLEKGPLPLAEALDVAVQIADALDKAHQQGVVHRDLKPGNVMLTRAGAKLLDFGLAKPVGDWGTAGDSESSTKAAPLTAEGTLLGTLQYMAPEQLEGKEADARTDIFAFGSLVYEMVTGKKAFEGRSQASLISAIMSSEPAPMNDLEPVTPRTLDRLIQRCMAKEPNERWQSARDLTETLNWIREGSVAAEPASARHASRERLAWLLAGACFLAALIIAAHYFTREPTAPAVTRFSVLTPESSRPVQIAISPDGRQLAYVSEETIWVRPLEALEPRELPGTENAWSLFWSPDSRFLGFFAQGKLKKVDITGAPPQTLCDVGDTWNGGTWSRDGVILFSTQVADGRSLIHRVSSAGGVLTPVTELDERREETSHTWPWFLPDGRHFLYRCPARRDEDTGIYVGSLDSEERRLIVQSDFMAQYAQGHLLFVREGALMAQPFDADRLQLSGEGFRVTESVMGRWDQAGFSVSTNGVLTYRGGTSTTVAPVWFDRNGRQLGSIEPAAGYDDIWLSPDGERMAAFFDGDIWIVDLETGSRSRFTFDPGLDEYPVWSPKGDRIVFTSNRMGAPQLYEKPSAGTGAPQLLVQSDDAYKAATDWSQDGRFILYTVVSSEPARDIWVLPMDGGEPYPYLQTPVRERHARFSPDGKWVAYASDETGRDEVYVQPFPATGGKWQISSRGGRMPRWRSDGKELYFLGLDQGLMATPVSPGGTFEHGIPKELFKPNLANTRYQVTENGQRFLIGSVPEEASLQPITVVLNWLESSKPR